MSLHNAHQCVWVVQSQSQDLQLRTTETDGLSEQWVLWNWIRLTPFCGCLSFQVDILDTSGDMQFPAMRRLSIATAHAFLLVYATTSAPSFASVRQCFDEIREQRADFQVCHPFSLTTDSPFVTTNLGANGRRAIKSQLMAGANANSISPDDSRGLERKDGRPGFPANKYNHGAGFWAK